VSVIEPLQKTHRSKKKIPNLFCTGKIKKNTT